jgi:hypothetical protein
MATRRPHTLYVTDLTYPARGRRYCDEDIDLTSRLRDDFAIAMCHPRDAADLVNTADLVVVRNSGPVVGYPAEYAAFRRRAGEVGVPVFNELTGKADMLGKQYLLELTAAGYPVIPTVAGAEHVADLPEAREYVVKPAQGADSAGLRFVPAAEVAAAATDGMLVQPRVDFVYEVSFYFVDRTFRYALFAPHPEERWLLEPYQPTRDDLAFAQAFVDWNDIDHGIQRVDACRSTHGDLLLVELEDLNPYLSLDRLDPATRDGAVAAIRRGLHDTCRAAAQR